MVTMRRVLASVLAAILLGPIGGSSVALANGATEYIRARIERIYDLLGSSGTAASAERQAAAR
ncbi:MAG TPA: hypothetical protein VK878_06635, partial [Candidatus Deferrimicrobiaceae bacterium]|nr:hypothetical protein [Candidatus Deferrimicrobiaceae bacterium]